MHILCTICSDLVNPAENIHATKCGHLFHHHCLSQWISRSKSCPQCRNKVTEKRMFRIYPTISNENTGDDVATLQSRLDDALLQLRQQKVSSKEKEEKLTAISADIKKNEDIIKTLEKKVMSRDSAVSALKEQLKYVKIQNKETQRLKEENEGLKKNMQTLNGLQKVLNATSEEVEQMLQGYTDVRTVATFATALKRQLEDKLIAVERDASIANNKRKAPEFVEMCKGQHDYENYLIESQAKRIKTSHKLNQVVIINDSNTSFDHGDGIMEILKNTNLSSRDECARAAAVIRWVIQQALSNSCPGVQLTRDLLVLGVPRGHAAALAEAADEQRDAYETNVKAKHGFMINKLTDVTLTPGPEGTIDTYKLSLFTDDVFTGEQKKRELLIEKSQAKLLLEKLKKAYKKMADLEGE